jgi:hypothetical protein
MVISGIYAAELEHDGIGTLLVAGRSIVFVQYDGLRVSWECETERVANEALWLFRFAAAQPIDIH